MRFLFLFLVFIGAFVIFPQSASAQAMGTYICGAGPGPGERQVGVTPGGNGVASLPICEADGQAVQSGPQQEWVNSYLAVAGHDEANNVWTAAGYRYSSIAATDALQACNNAMGSGCKIYMESYNGSVVTLRDSLGGLWWSTNETLDKARRSAFNNCESKGHSCVEVGWTTSTAWLEDVGGPRRDQPKVFAPNNKDFRKSYAAAAWVTDKEKWTQKVWFSGKHPTAEAANEAVLSACNKDSGTVCALAHTVSDTAIYIGVDEARGIRVGSAVNVEASAQKIKDDCKKTNSECKLTESFRAWYEGTWVHDPYYVAPEPAKTQ
jgi:hypothetical protein